MTTFLPRISSPQTRALSTRQSATWETYLAYRDSPDAERMRLFFNEGLLLLEMGSEGINHAQASDLFVLILGLWFINYSDQSAESLGRCLLEKTGQKASSPDLVVYVGEGTPQWQVGEPRRIDLARWRVPDLVGEISDTTLATDLDEKKHLYATLGIPEYWVIDVLGKRVWVFQLDETGCYQPIAASGILAGLPVELLERTLNRLACDTNIQAANWFVGAVAQWQKSLTE